MRTFRILLDRSLPSPQPDDFIGYGEVKPRTEPASQLYILTCENCETSNHTQADHAPVAKAEDGSWSTSVGAVWRKYTRRST